LKARRERAMLSEAKIREYIKTISEEVSKLKSKYPDVVRDYQSVEPQEEIKVEGLGEVKSVSLTGSSTGQPRLTVFAVDSSTRYLRDTSVGMVLLGMSTYSTTDGLKLYPYDGKSRFIGLWANEGVLKELEKVIDKDYVAVRNRVGDYYEERSYPYLDDVADELRFESETEALKTANADLVIVDGPIYPTPLELVADFNYSPGNLRVSHRRSYALLIKDRLDVVKGKRVLGVVKRLEKSRKLYKVKEVNDFLGNLPSMPDPEVMRMLYSKLCKGEQVCAFGPFKLEYDISVEGILQGVPPKYAYYVVVRRVVGPWSFFRVEALDMDSLNYAGVVFSRLTERGIPTWIEVVDRASKKVSASLFVIGYRIASQFLDIIHDDKLAFETAVTELGT